MKPADISEILQVKPMKHLAEMPMDEAANVTG